jgi:hypothetical protein
VRFVAGDRRLLFVRTSPDGRHQLVLADLESDRAPEVPCEDTLAPAVAPDGTSVVCDVATAPEGRERELVRWDLRAMSREELGPATDAAPPEHASDEPRAFADLALEDDLGRRVDLRTHAGEAIAFPGGRLVQSGCPNAGRCTHRELSLRDVASGRLRPLGRIEGELAALLLVRPDVVAAVVRDETDLETVHLFRPSTGRAARVDRTPPDGLLTRNEDVASGYILLAQIDEPPGEAGTLLAVDLADLSVRRLATDVATHSAVVHPASSTGPAVAAWLRRLPGTEETELWAAPLAPGATAALLDRGPLGLAFALTNGFVLYEVGGSRAGVRAAPLPE